MGNFFDKLWLFVSRGKEISPEIGLFRLICLTASLLSLFLILPSNAFQNLSPNINLIIAIYGISIALLYARSCRGNHHILTCYVLTVLVLNFSWFYSYGSEGSVGFYFFPAMLYAMFFFHGRTRWILFLLLLADYCALVLIGHVHPSLVTPYGTDLDRLLELVSGFSCSFIAGALVVWVVVTTLEKKLVEHRLTELELQAKNADIEQFIYTVSHDLRSPLVTIKNFMGHLEQDMHTGDQERIEQDFRFIHSAADRMKLLLDELLELSRIGRIEAPPSKISFQEIVTEVMDSLAGIINEKGAQVTIAKSDLVLTGDHRRLCQVWQNLIENAIKYSRDDLPPSIELGIMHTVDERIFYVKDNGVGIRPEYQDKIFRIFEKLDPHSPGAGLGLSMVQRIVEKNGGRIWVESEGEETGTCFLFTLPHMIASSPI